MERRRRHMTSSDEVAAFPMMHQMTNGEKNVHADQTSMKPVKERQENELHPSQVLDINEGINYYTYSWMLDGESVTATNYIAFGSILFIIAVTLYFIIGTKLVKFIQFFMTQKHYSNLGIKVRMEQKDGNQAADAEANQNNASAVLQSYQTPRMNNKNAVNSFEMNATEKVKLLDSNQTDQRKRNSGLCRGLFYHASDLVQFYTPLFGICSKTLALPKYVLMFQIMLRAVLLISLTVTAGFIYLNFALDESERDCILSRNMKNTSYFCLNESLGEEAANPESIRAPLFAIGGVCALLSGFTMFAVSHSIFSNFTKYLDKLLHISKESAVDTDNTQVMAAVMRQINIPSSDTAKQVSPKKKSRKKQSPSKRKYDSVSSFRALLDRDSDASMMNMIDTAGYDSGVQTAANSNFLSGTPGHNSILSSGGLNVTTQSSARLTAANTTQNSDVIAKPRAYAAAVSNAVADLLPIDEDVDDEKCSPIKPKKRTSEDSPFKRNFNQQQQQQQVPNTTAFDSMAQPVSKNQESKLIVVSDEDGDDVDDDDILRAADEEMVIGSQEINTFAKQPSGGGESMSFNGLLRSAGLEMTPTNKKDEGEISSEALQIMVEKIDVDQEIEEQKCQQEEYQGQDHFEGLKTLNSGRTQTQAENEPVEKKVGVTRNHPSIQINSFSGVDDSTLQLETIAAIKPQAASSGKDAGQNPGQNTEQNSSYFGNQQTEEDHIKPQTVRINRPLTSQINLGIMTPFSQLQDYQVGVSHELQTEDKNSLGLPYIRNADILSSDQISRISNSQRPESGRRVTKPRRPAANRIPSGFQIQDREEKIGRKNLSSNRCTILAIVSSVILIFGICMSVYFLHSLPQAAVKIILIAVASAFVCDLAFQLLMLTVLSARQLCYDLKSRELPLDTYKLKQMTAQAKKLATQVFSQYREESALLMVSYQDEIDIMLDKLERDMDKQQSETNSESSTENARPTDILVKDIVQKFQIDDFTIEISQQLRFGPPKSQLRSNYNKINLIQPDAKANKLNQQNNNEQNFGEVINQDGLQYQGLQNQPTKFQSEADDNANSLQRRKRKAQIQTFERTQQFFAEQQPKNRSNRLQKVSSPLKRSATILRQSIENIELEKLESDFPSRPHSKEQTQQLRDKSQTPDDKHLQNLQNARQSSNNKMSHFETPKGQQVSQVKLKQSGIDQELNTNKSDRRSEKKQEVRRKLILKRSSNQTIEASKEENKTQSLAGKLSAKKNYLEDALGEAQDFQGMIMNSSSKSIIGAGIDVQGGRANFLGSNYQHSSIELQEKLGEHFLSQDKVFGEDHYASQDNRDANRESQNERGTLNYDQIPGNETYSPIFSSVNRKPGNAKIDSQQNYYQQNQKTGLAEEQAYANNTLAKQLENQIKIPCQMSRTGYDNSRSLGTAELIEKSKSASKDGTSNSNNLVQQIMSHSKVLSKQQSFNSPTSLHEQLQLTNQKIKNSLEGSSLQKGRRKMVMLDEAGVSKQSLQYGPQNIGTALLNSSAQGIPFLHQSSIGDSSGSRLTPVRNADTAQLNLVAGIQKSQDSLQGPPQTAPIRVLMQDQGQSDFLPEECDTPNEKSNEDDDKVFMSYANEVAQITEKAANNEEISMAEIAYEGADRLGDGVGGKNTAGVTPSNMKSEIDNPSSVFNSQVKCSSVQSKQAKSAKNGGEMDLSDPSNVYKNNMQVGGSTEKTLLAATETKNATSSKTSAFQRLVMASKRMMQKKSSAKKDAVVKSNRLAVKTQYPLASDSAAANMQSTDYQTQKLGITDTSKILKEQSQQIDQNTPSSAVDGNKAIFAQPFRVQSRQQKHRGGGGLQSATAPTTSANSSCIKKDHQQNSDKPVAIEMKTGAFATENTVGETTQHPKTTTQQQQVKPTKHTIEGLQVLAQKSLDSTFNLPDETDNNQQQLQCEKISEILEHESMMEIDTPMQPGGRLMDGSQISSVAAIGGHQQDNHQKSLSGAYLVPVNFSKEQVNPVKRYTNSSLLDVPIDPSLDTNTNNKRTTLPKSKQLTTKNSGGSSRDRLSRQGSSKNQKNHQPNNNNDQQSNRGGSQEPINKLNRGFKQRKNSQMTQKDEKGLLRVARRNSKNSHNVPKAGGTHEKRKLMTQSSRENTVSSVSIDFDKMDKQREEDYSDYSKMISAGSTISRLEDQRRRLESFLSLAQQAKSKRDINKIQDMIRQIDETQKPLPISRINELKLLELMASPYNQSLIAMIKVELDISRKLKEHKKLLQQSQNRLTKSKFTLPKHLTNQNSQCFVEEVLKTDDSKQTFEQKYEITRPQGQPETMGGNGVLSDNRLTTVVNIRPKGIQSCRSNNDVAPPKTFNRSPSHLNQSPLSVGVCQQVLSGKRPIDQKAVDYSSALDSQSGNDGGGGRHSYLRSVGNAVVVNKYTHEVRKSVDRLRTNHGQISNQMIAEEQPVSPQAIGAHTQPDLLVESLKQACLEAEGRRGTAPHFGGGDCQQSRQHLKHPDFNQQQMIDLSTGGQQSPSELSSAQNIKIKPNDLQKRSTTSYGIQQIGPMMQGREGFVKRITPLQSKSALGQNNKENQIQSKALQNQK